MNRDSAGRAGLNLRGLGDNRTLTLVEGRRLMPVNGDGETDLNVLPPALIESVEIVTGGASAVYGSDAIAGVVNLRLRRDLDGVELGVRWGQTDRGDGEEYDVSLTAGTDFADGRGSVVGYVDDRAQINQPAREFSRAPFKTTDVTVPHKDYFDIDAGYSFDDGWLDGLTIRAGVQNLTDELPPIVPTKLLANTDPSQFDVLGRRYYVTLALHF